MRHETADRALTVASWACALVAILVPASMIVYLSAEGLSALSWSFLSDRPRGVPPGTQGGILPAIVGSLSLVGVGLALAVPLGVGGAVYLSAYATSPFWKRTLRSAAECLAGVPSILYGLFGYAVLVVALGLGVSLRAGGLTLGLVMFPIILIGVHEALAAVPSELSEAVVALGVTKAHALRRVLLRQAWPSIVAAIALAAGHAAGSAAPVLYTASTFTSPGGVRWQDPVMTLPTHLYHLAGEALSPRQAHGTALVLMGGLLLANAFALLLKGRARP